MKIILTIIFLTSLIAQSVFANELPIEAEAEVAKEVKQVLASHGDWNMVEHTNIKGEVSYYMLSLAASEGDPSSPRSTQSHISIGVDAAGEILIQINLGISFLSDGFVEGACVQVDQRGCFKVYAFQNLLYVMPNENNQLLDTKLYQDIKAGRKLVVSLKDANDELILEDVFSLKGSTAASRSWEKALQP